MSETTSNQTTPVITIEIAITMYSNLEKIQMQTYTKSSRVPVAFETTNKTYEEERKEWRHFMGEDFLEWAEFAFDRGGWINKKIEKATMYNNFLSKYPNERRYITPRRFRDKLKVFCKYMNLKFNTGAGPDGRIKYKNKEMYLISNDWWLPSDHAKL